MNNLLLIGLGGAVGAVSRYWVSQLAISLFGKGFPFGTLAVNVLGSLFMGLIYGLFENGGVSPQLRAMIGVGFLGALTTFSTFSMESVLLLHQGEWLKAALNILINVILCLLAAYAGMQLVMAKL